MEGVVRKFLHAYVATVVAFWSLLLMPMMPAVAAADTCTWTGAVSNLWSLGTNWSGCDNGGVPENGDNLSFPGGAANLSNTNDIVGLSVVTVTVSGTGYTLGGNSLIITDTFNFVGTGNSANLPLTFSNIVGSTTLSNTGNNSIDQNVTLATTGQTFNVVPNPGTLTFGNTVVVSGATGNVNFSGSGGTIQSGTTDWTYTTSGASQLTLDAIFDCRTNQCFGFSTNPVTVSGVNSAILLGAPSLVVPNPLTISAHNTSGNLRATNAAFTTSPRWNGPITLSSDASVGAPADNVILALSDINLNTFTLNFIGLGSSFATGVISGSGDIDINTPDNRVSLGGNSTYSGVTTVRSGSAVTINSNNALGSTVGNTVVESGATISASSGSANLTIPENITISGTGQGGAFSTGAITHEGNPGIDFDHTYSGIITLAGNTRITHVGATSTNITINNLAGTGDVTFVPSVFGDSLNLAGSSPNTYSGTLIVNGSFINLQKNGAATGNITITDTVMNAFVAMSAGLTDAIADTAVVSVGPESSSANFSVANGESETIGALTSDGNVFVGAGATLTLAGSGTETFSGSFAGGGTIAKTGTGTQILTGTCGVSDNFNVLSGTLVFGSPFTTVDCDVTINGGTLKGTGQVNDVVGNSGNFNAGTSPGCINVSGNLTLSAPTVFEEEIAGATACSEYDQTTVTGNATLGGATLNTLPSYTPAVGTVFTILQAGTISGTFNGLANGDEFTANGIRFRINYNTSTVANHTVTLTVLGGTLAQTGANTNLITFAAIGLVFLALGGLVVERTTRRRKYARIK